MELVPLPQEGGSLLSYPARSAVWTRAEIDAFHPLTPGTLLLIWGMVMSFLRNARASVAIVLSRVARSRSL